MSSALKRIREGDSLHVASVPPESATLSGACQVMVPEQAQALQLEVPNLWPGESAKVRVVTRAKKQARAFGKVLQLEQGHPQRVPVSCKHHPGAGPSFACGGCPWLSFSVPAQRQLKAQILSRQLGVELPDLIGTAQRHHYRLAAKRVVAKIGSRIVLGSYLPRSHQVAQMQACRVDHPSITQAFELAQDLLQEQGVLAYREKDQSGELRYLWAKSNKTQLHLTAIGAHALSPKLRRALEALQAALPPGSAVSWQEHAAQGNAMRSDSVATRIGPEDPLPCIQLLGQSMPLDALGFLQPNPAVAELCYQNLLGLDTATPHQGKVAIDLYAGYGLTSQALSNRFEQVYACELRPPVGALPMVQAMSAREFLANHREQSAPKPDLVIANPPRAGMHAKVCAHLKELAPAQISIMSCGPKGLAKNLSELTQMGYRVDKVLGFDTLPHTAHVELVAHLSRV